jgi:LCP family protein required for cell wall assembly
MSENEPNKTQRPLFTKWFFWVAVVVFIVASFGAAYAAYTTVKGFSSVQGILNPEGIPAGSEQTASTPLPGETPSASSQPAQTAPRPQPWDGASRVTILLMGLDFRDWEAGETPRTDTMIVVTIDPISKTIGMINIPRDMWVEIPNFERGKINTAYYLGESYKLPGGGPELAMKTIEAFLGVPINYYAQVDFNTFVDFIDMIEGVEVEVPAEIKVDPLGKENTVVLQPGKQVMLGAVALAYARARYTEGSDFDRAQRQQQVIMAIRDKMLKPGVMAWMIKNSATIYGKLGEGVHTNFTLDQIIQLGLLASKVPSENIHHAIISTDMVGLGKSPDGLDIIRPIPDKIRELRDTIFISMGAVGPSAVSTDPLVLMQAESSRVGIQNGTQMPGIAAQTGEYLRSLGLNIVDSTNADQFYGATTLIDYTGKPYTIQYLASLMNVPQNRIYSRFNPASPVDVQVVVGDDWAANNPMQ